MSTIRPEEDPLARLAAEFDPSVEQFARFCERLTEINCKLNDEDNPFDPDEVEDLIPDLDENMPYELGSEVYVTGTAVIAPLDRENITTLPRIFLTKTNLIVNGVELQFIYGKPEIFYSFLCKEGDGGYEAPDSNEPATHTAYMQVETCHIEKVATTPEEVGAELGRLLPEAKEEIDMRLAHSTDTPTKIKNLGSLSITHTSMPHNHDLFQQRDLLTMYLHHAFQLDDEPLRNITHQGIFFPEDTAGEFDIERPRHISEPTERSAWIEAVGAMPTVTFEEPDVVAVNPCTSTPVVIIREHDPSSASPEGYGRRIAIPLSQDVTIT